MFAEIFEIVSPVQAVAISGGSWDAKKDYIKKSFDYKFQQGYKTHFIEITILLVTIIKIKVRSCYGVKCGIP